MLVLRVSAGYISDYSLFNICCSSKNCTFARCASAADVVHMDIDVFGNKLFILILFYNDIFLFIKIIIAFNRNTNLTVQCLAKLHLFDFYCFLNGSVPYFCILCVCVYFFLLLMLAL